MVLRCLLDPTDLGFISVAGSCERDFTYTFHNGVELFSPVEYLSGFHDFSTELVIVLSGSENYIFMYFYIYIYKQYRKYFK